MVEEIKQEEALSSENASVNGAENKPANSQNEAFPTNEPKKIENLEKALRIFKRKSAGIISEYKKREAYDSPSVKRKKKSKEARKHKNKSFRFNNNY